MKKNTLLILLSICSINLFAQDAATSGSTKTAYFASASEIIFSWGDVTAAAVPGQTQIDPKAILRFSPVFNIEEQFHYDFAKSVGLYTGLSLRNVGFINELNDTVKMKQRVYTLGVPLALKLGQVNGGNYLTVGAEAEFAIAYKQKVFVNDEKNKTVEWFSDRTNIFLPSAFVELKSQSGVYLKFKYYLTDFLTENNQKTNVSGVDFVPTKSTLMYLSIGMVIPDSKVKKMK
jgi:hypothetical protein